MSDAGSRRATCSAFSNVCLAPAVSPAVPWAAATARSASAFAVFLYPQVPILSAVEELRMMAAAE